MLDAIQRQRLERRGALLVACVVVVLAVALQFTHAAWFDAASEADRPESSGVKGADTGGPSLLDASSSAQMDESKSDGGEAPQ